MNLYTLKTKVRHIPWIDNLVSGFSHTDAFTYFYKLLHTIRLDEYSHDPAMKLAAEKSQTYFANNQGKINQIMDRLADKKSKDCFQAQIRCRQNVRLCPTGSVTNQYFPKDIIHLSNQEVFVDCGAFTGDSILKFKNACPSQYKKIVAFEANPVTFKKLQANHFDKCTCLNCGVWDKKDTLSFLADQLGNDKMQSSSMDRLVLNQQQATHYQVPVERMDDIALCADMTFLKMDIEGAELNALRGAEQTIRKNCPTLAICVYHSDEDLLEIPLWIMSLGLNYTYYMRHHNWGPFEVVFYAVPNN